MKLLLIQPACNGVSRVPERPIIEYRLQFTRMRLHRYSHSALVGNHRFHLYARDRRVSRIRVHVNPPFIMEHAKADRRRDTFCSPDDINSRFCGPYRCESSLSCLASNRSALHVNFFFSRTYYVLWSVFTCDHIIGTLLAPASRKAEYGVYIVARS